MSDLYVGRVIAVHQHDSSLDIQLSYDGSVLTAVPLMGPMMTTSSGLVNMHHPEGNKADAAGSKTRDCYVIVARTSGGYIALGFISPQVNQMCFDRKDFKVDRHASDVYSTIDGDGNIELTHPSGTYVRIGTNPAHEDLTGKDFDKLWKVTRNKTKEVHLAVSVAKNGAVQASLKIDPDGNITITGKTLAIDAPVAISGPSLTHNGVNVGSTHTHGGVKSGGDRSDGPG